MPFPHFKHLGSAPGLKVKKAAHEHVAKLLSWSMGWAAAGLWPPVGFHKEVLDPKSLRGKMVNQELANGWRTLFLWFAMVIVYSKLTYNHPSQPFHNHIYIYTQWGSVCPFRVCEFNFQIQKYLHRCSPEGWLIGHSGLITKHVKKRTVSQGGLTACFYANVVCPNDQPKSLILTCGTWTLDLAYHAILLRSPIRLT